MTSKFFLDVFRILKTHSYFTKTYHTKAGLPVVLSSLSFNCYAVLAGGHAHVGMSDFGMSVYAAYCAAMPIVRLPDDVTFDRYLSY